jgi:transcriptional regulator with XRE-family HTH domain
MIPITSPKMLGKALRQHRLKQGLTQSQAGGKFNIPQKTVSNIEAGLPGVRMASIFKYMSALGLEMQLDYRNKNNRNDGVW